MTVLSTSLLERANEVGIRLEMIKIISKSYEKKDKEIAPPFYLENGVKDILVFDPRSLEIWHHTAVRTTTFKSPTAFTLECGCTVEI